MSNNMTGKPSIDRPWMKYYPEVLQKMIQIPECTVKEYLKKYCPGEDVAAMDFYGTQITWKTVFEQSEAAARSLKAVGFKEGDGSFTSFWRQNRSAHLCCAGTTH